MGAHFSSHIFPACSEAELQKKFDDLIERLRDENGSDGYNGSFTTCHQGLHICRESFDTVELASAWLDEHAEKWGAVLAVKVGEFASAFPATKAAKELEQRFNDLSKELESFYPDILARAHKQASSTKKCTSCGSSIAVKHLYTHELKYIDRMDRHVFRGSDLVTCPVCHNNLLETETDKKRLASLKERHAELSKRVSEAKEARLNDPKAKAAKWVLGGWCAD